MPPAVGKYWDLVQKRLGAMEAKQRKLLGYGAVLLVITGALLALVWAYEPYGVLFRDLESAEAGRIVQRLQDAKIPYRISEQGRAIEVPEAKVSETRLMLASSGVAGEIPGGWELLDSVPMGASEYTVRKRHQRALEGELSRTISAMESVHSTRVHLALPQRSLFADRDQLPTASVVVKLVAGQQLNKHEVRGIQSLVSHAVEGLKEDSVTLVDTAGEVLSGDDANEMGGLAGADAHNKVLERRIISMLEPVVGQGKVVARVSVDYDEATVVETSKTFLPNKTAVRSEEHQEQEKTGPTVSSGVAGAQSNNPGKPAVAKGGADDTSSRDLTNYEVSYQTRRVERAQGAVQRISAAVLVAPPQSPIAEGGEAKAVQPTAQEFSPEQLEEIQQIVMTAIGFDAKRGDQVHVSSMAFLPDDNALPMASVWLPTLLPALKLVLLGLIVVLVLLFVIRPLVKGLGSPKIPSAKEKGRLFDAKVGDASEGYDLQSHNAAASLPPPTEDTEERRARALQAAMEQPERAAEIVRAWLSSDRHKEEEDANAEKEQDQEQAEEIAA